MSRESPEIHTKRTMAWERAKGELRSIYGTYWERDDRLGEYKDRVEEFIRSMEDETVCVE